MMPIFSRMFKVGFAVAKATVFCVGLAVILAVVFGLASTAEAHTRFRSLFHLNHANTAQALTTLVGALPNPILGLTNDGDGAALELRVNSGAPMTVNSDAKVDKLNADKLDGKDSGQIGVNGVEQVADSSPMDSSSSKTTNATCPEGKIAVAGGARIQGNFTNVALHESHQILQARANGRRPPTKSTRPMTFGCSRRMPSVCSPVNPSRRHRLTGPGFTRAVSLAAPTHRTQDRGVAEPDHESVDRPRAAAGSGHACRWGARKLGISEQTV